LRMQKVSRVVYKVKENIRYNFYVKITFLYIRQIILTNNTQLENSSQAFVICLPI